MFKAAPGQASRIHVLNGASADRDGTFMLLLGGTDLGTGLDTVAIKIAAEILKILMEDLSYIAADTDVSPFDVGAYASSGTYFSGGAVYRAAETMRDQILAAAAMAPLPHELVLTRVHDFGGAWAAAIGVLILLFMAVGVFTGPVNAIAAAGINREWLFAEDFGQGVTLAVMSGYVAGMAVATRIGDDAR